MNNNDSLTVKDTNEWIPKEIVKKLVGITRNFGVLSAGLFCIVNSTAEVNVNGIIFSQAASLFMGPAVGFIFSVTTLICVKGVNKSVKFIKNASNEKQSKKDCSYSVYLTTNIIRGIDKNDICRTIRECYKTAGQILNLKQKFHRIDHWKLEFRNNMDDRQNLVIGLKNSNKIIRCGYPLLDKYGCDENSTTFYLFGLNNSKNDIDKMLQSFQGEGHPMNNRPYNISSDNCQHYVARILHQIKENKNFIFLNESTLIKNVFKVIKIHNDGRIKNLNRLSIYVTKIILKDNSDPKFSPDER